MTFIINRTSGRFTWPAEEFSMESKPCANAHAKKHTKEIHRLIPDENGRPITLVTTKDEYYWEVEINSLEELLDLVKETQPESGIIIFGPEDDYGPSLEIYDGCRE